MRTRNILLIAVLSVLIIGFVLVAAYLIQRPVVTPSAPVSQDDDTSGEAILTYQDLLFGRSVTYEPSAAAIDTAVGDDFDVADIDNIADMERAYGFTFTPEERAALASRKFVVKDLLDTSIRPSAGRDNAREFVQMYDTVKGPRDPRGRAPENALFWSSDVFFNAYNNLFTELLKEMENETFYPAAKAFAETLYRDAEAKLAAATTADETREWTKVRDYLAVPYAILSNVEPPLAEEDYYSGGRMADPASVAAEHATADAAADTYDTAEAFINGLHLGAESTTAVLADLKAVYEAKGKGRPAVFAEEYLAYAEDQKIDFMVDFTQFTPRGTYTSSSLRRQYFRGMKWFIMVPFFLKSQALTDYAYGVSTLLGERPDLLKKYTDLDATIGFMVGKSDDLAPTDYLRSYAADEGAMTYLENLHDPRIKDLAAFYPEVGVEQSDDVRLKTKGMRFFSGKFIIDSYWTGFLTQGDEAPRPGYAQKLPPMASMLEVMTLLGSDYARAQLPKLDFYHEGTSKAIDQALGELEAENARLTDADWQQNLYTAWLWTIKGLFGWQAEHASELPQFMRSLGWEAKTLQTAAAWWTELRHATILYAKQSFAELGAGGPGCDEREVPAPPKAYIEPQAEAYARLRYLAKRTDEGLKEQGYDLRNMVPLESFIGLMDTVLSYAEKELGNAELHETLTVTEGPDYDVPGATCTTHGVGDDSDWERLRIGVMDGMKSSLPVPVEGPVLSAKDRRAAIVADVHTGGDSDHPTRILYEANGVPYIIFTAVRDVNGARLTVGFISSHYEFTEPYGGQRKTDEDWQRNFYIGDDPYDAFDYAGKASWPTPNDWYAPLFE